VPEIIFWGEGMKKVLIVAYSFPPVGGAGVQRPTKFVKYLRDYGWEPSVLTVENPSVPVVDESLLKDIPDGVKIFSARTFEPSYTAKQGFIGSQCVIFARFKSVVKRLVLSLLLPDVQVLWWPFMVMKLISTLRSEKPDCLFVTAPPFSTFVPVVAIGRLFRVPVVVDFRDEWSFSRQNWENSQKSVLSSFVDCVFERFVVNEASAITVASPYYQSSLAKQYPNSSDKIHTITNGYDPDDFAGIDLSKSGKSDTGLFTIVYTGTVWRATSLEPFCNGIRSLAETEPAMVSKIKLKVIGRIVAEELAVIDTLRKHIVVETIDYVPHEMIFPEIASADLLLLTLSDLPGADKIIPGKTFEYIASRKNIFAIVPEGVTSEIVREFSKLVAGPRDSDIISRLIFDSINNGCNTVHSISINKYSRELITRNLSEIFCKLL